MRPYNECFPSKNEGSGGISSVVDIACPLFENLRGGQREIYL